MCVCGNVWKCEGRTQTYICMMQCDGICWNIMLTHWCYICSSIYLFSNVHLLLHVLKLIRLPSLWLPP